VELIVLAIGGIVALAWSLAWDIDDAEQDYQGPE
jgi:hypothetical protein